MGLQFYQTFGYAAFHFGDIPAEYVASNSSGIVLIPFLQAAFAESSLRKNCFRIKRKARKWVHAQRSCTVKKAALTSSSS